MGKEINDSPDFHAIFFFLISIILRLFVLENKSWQISPVGSGADKSSVN